MVIHGGDLTLLGHDSNLDWCRGQIQQHLDIKVCGRLGLGPCDQNSIRILNRVVTWGSTGITYEPDQRHAELIVLGAGSQWKDKAVSTPGVKLASDSEDIDDHGPLSGVEATHYRALVGRDLDVSQDCTDIQYVVAQLSRSMSSPTNGDWRHLKRLARYLGDKTRFVLRYGYQSREPLVHERGCRAPLGATCNLRKET